MKRYRIHGETLRDIPILPDRISPEPEGWLLEYWCRMDPRVSYVTDIVPRIRPDLRPNHASRFSMARMRFRQDCHLLGWVKRGKRYDMEKARIIGAARQAGVNIETTNSTRGFSWGLADPTRGEAGGRVEMPGSYIRLQNTREHGSTQQNVLVVGGNSSSSSHAGSLQVEQPSPGFSTLSTPITADQPRKRRRTQPPHPIARRRKSIPDIMDDYAEQSDTPSRSGQHTTRDTSRADSGQLCCNVKSSWSTTSEDAPGSPDPDFRQPEPGSFEQSSPLTHAQGHAVQSIASFATFRRFDESLAEFWQPLTQKPHAKGTHGNVPGLYEGYARSNDSFVLDVSGTYVPVASSSSRTESINPPALCTKPVKHGAFSPVQHTERNFYQRDVIMHETAKSAAKENLEAPDQEAMLLANELVEAFYERDAKQLLDSLGSEWQRTRSDYHEFFQRVQANPRCFYEDFPRLMDAARDYVKEGIEGVGTVTRMTSWPDSRLIEEREMYEKVWNFERRRWNQYVEFSLRAEPF
jgi:hypothetical protein